MPCPPTNGRRLQPAHVVELAGGKHKHARAALLGPAPATHNPACGPTCTECSSWWPSSSPSCPLSRRGACSLRKRAAAAGEGSGMTPVRTSARRPAAAAREDALGRGGEKAWQTTGRRALSSGSSSELRAVVK
jgi:hypothetical protein